MVNSSLYGPEVCSSALVKSKEKTKLSSKQILVRLAEQSKIMDNYGSSNNHVVSLTADFGI